MLLIFVLRVRSQYPYITIVILTREISFAIDLIIGGYYAGISSIRADLDWDSPDWLNEFL